MTITTNRTVLKFHGSMGGIIRLSIPRARLDKTGEQARASMEAMIENGAILTSEGRPTSIKGAHIVSTTRTPITA